MSIEIFNRGDSIARGFGLGGENVTGWTCAIQLRDYETKEIAASVDRAVTDINTESTEFSAMITSAESEQLIVGRKYVFAAQLDNATTGERAEGFIVLECAQDWVYA